MSSPSHDGVRFQQLASGRSTPRSSLDSHLASDSHDADDEAFALLSDDVSSMSGDIELDDLDSSGARPTGPHSGLSEVDKQILDAINAERSLTPREAIRAYPMAVFWSLIVSLCVIMEGYDTILIASFFAHPEFAKKYGDGQDSEGRDQLSALWQAVLGNSSTFGCIFGVVANGFIVERYGQKFALISSLFVLSGCIFITFFATNKVMLMLGQIACGLPWGVFASSAPAYASEVLPWRCACI
ncbi:maltose permease MAL31 [Colletotrichum tofieldiae]|nr:maltose permease MAL31 [Colletotrichum tofieldiae]